MGPALLRLWSRPHPRVLSPIPVSRGDNTTQSTASRGFSEGQRAVRTRVITKGGPLGYHVFNPKSCKLESNLLTWETQTHKSLCVELIHRFIENDLKSIEFGVLNTA